jgi:hypothetical protein
MKMQYRPISLLREIVRDGMMSSKRIKNLSANPTTSYRRCPDRIANALCGRAANPEAMG